jgi:hypothetical protein
MKSVKVLPQQRMPALLFISEPTSSEPNYISTPSLQRGNTSRACYTCTQLCQNTYTPVCLGEVSAKAENWSRARSVQRLQGQGSLSSAYMRASATLLCPCARLRRTRPGGTRFAPMPSATAAMRSSSDSMPPAKQSYKLCEFTQIIPGSSRAFVGEETRSDGCPRMRSPAAKHRGAVVACMSAFLPLTLATYGMDHSFVAPVTALVGKTRRAAQPDCPEN